MPAKSGYTGSWPEHSSPITANTTITAVYTPIPTEPSEPPAATHTVTFRVTYSASYGYTVKTMTVEDGYVLTAADYPTTYGVTWQQYTSPITSDVTVNGTYSWGGYGAVEEAETTGEVPAEAAAESTAVSRTGSTTLVKTVTETYDYVYNGGRLSQVKKTTSTTTSSGTTNATDTLNFTYDANGTPMAVKYNNTNYYYVTNLQGDVTAILSTSGTAVAQYTYDAWGNILTTGGSMASTLGTLNPLRYRGYVYDTETGLYYLQSRYYNPVMGRFINIDLYITTGQGFLGNNTFLYCGNNAVNFSDPDGYRYVCNTFHGGGTKKRNIFEKILDSITTPTLQGGTFSVGVSAGSSWGGAGGGWSGCVSVDTAYNYALQETTSLSASTGGGASGGLAFTCTNAKDVQDLSGESNCRGVTLCGIAGISIDLISFVPASNPDTINWGICVTLLVGADFDGHRAVSNTESTRSWNPFKELKRLLQGG